MQVSDLRIGNYVYNSHNTQMKVAALFEDKTIYLDFEGDENLSYWEENVAHLKGIPITAERLEKLGAIKRQVEFSSYFLCGRQFNFIDGIWLDYVTRKPLSYIHELQNFYYTMEGKELKISKI